MIQVTDNDALFQNLHRGFPCAARRTWFVCLLAVVALQSYSPSCLVAQSGRIAHDPWALRDAELLELEDGLVAAAGVTVSDSPAVLYHADRQDVEAWPLTSARARP